MSILIHAFSASIMVCTNTVLSLSQVTRFSSFSTNKQASKQMRERRKECAATRSLLPLPGTWSSLLSYAPLLVL